MMAALQDPISSANLLLVTYEKLGTRLSAFVDKEDGVEHYLINSQMSSNSL
jgi:hypothetical protein